MVVIWSLIIFLFLFIPFNVLCRKTNCLGPPYLYATMHDKIENILKYSRDGCLLEKEVLYGYPHYGKMHHYVEYRSMVFGKYRNQSVLYVADAMTRDSYLSIFSECDSQGHRYYLDTVISTRKNPGANHIYGICFDEDENIYISSQHTDNILRFSKDTFHPLPLPPYARQNRKWREYFKGTFYQFGAPEEHPVSSQGIRAILRMGDTIWTANEDINGIAIISILTGEILNIVVLPSPIGLYFDETLQVIFTLFIIIYSVFIYIYIYCVFLARIC